MYQQKQFKISAKKNTQLKVLRRIQVRPQNTKTQTKIMEPLNKIKIVESQTVGYEPSFLTLSPIERNPMCHGNSYQQGGFQLPKMKTTPANPVDAIQPGDRSQTHAIRNLAALRKIQTEHTDSAPAKQQTNYNTMNTTPLSMVDILHPLVPPPKEKQNWKKEFLPRLEKEEPEVLILASTQATQTPEDWNDAQENTEDKHDWFQISDDFMDFLNKDIGLAKESSIVTKKQATLILETQLLPLTNMNLKKRKNRESKARSRKKKKNTTVPSRSHIRNLAREKAYADAVQKRETLKNQANLAGGTMTIVPYSSDSTQPLNVSLTEYRPALDNILLD